MAISKKDLDLFITRKEADRIRYARKKADVSVIAFNDWLKKEFDCKVSELKSKDVDKVIAGIATINGTSDDTSHDASNEALSKPVVEPETPSEIKPIEPERKRFRPYVLFYFSNPWFVPRLTGVIYAFIKQGIQVYIHFDFPMLEDSMSLQEALAIKKLKKSSKTFRHKEENDGKEDILFMDDPSVPGIDRFKAPTRIGVQPTPIKINPSLVAGIKRLTQYYTWGKQEKADLKRLGVNGSLITISGSPWLSYLAGLVAKGDYYDAGTAVLYPPLGHIGCKQYWKGSGVIGVLTEMNCKIIIIRQNRRDPNWLPQHFRMMDYLEPLNAAYEIPRYCIAPPGVPLVEPAALKVPTLRLKLGQVITRKMLEQCKHETLPDRYINSDAEYTIVMSALRFFHAERKRQINL